MLTSQIQYTIVGNATISNHWQLLRRFFTKHIRNEHERALVDWIVQRELDDLRQALLCSSSEDTTDSVQFLSTVMKQLDSRKHMPSMTCLQRSMTPVGFAEWMESEDLLLSLLLPLRNMSANRTRIVDGYIRLHFESHVAVPRDVILLMQQHVDLRPDAPTMDRIADICIFMDSHGKLRQAHVESLWDAITASTSAATISVAVLCKLSESRLKRNGYVVDTQQHTPLLHVISILAAQHTRTSAICAMRSYQRSFISSHITRARIVGCCTSWLKRSSRLLCAEGAFWSTGISQRVSQITGTK